MFAAQRHDRRCGGVNLDLDGVVRCHAIPRSEQVSRRAARAGLRVGLCSGVGESRARLREAGETCAQIGIARIGESDPLLERIVSSLTRATPHRLQAPERVELRLAQTTRIRHSRTSLRRACIAWAREDPIWEQLEEFGLVDLRTGLIPRLTPLGERYRTG